MSSPCAHCAVCGEHFIPRAGGAPQLYCSARCRNKARYARRSGNPAHIAYQQRYKLSYNEMRRYLRQYRKELKRGTIG